MLNRWLHRQKILNSKRIIFISSVLLKSLAKAFNCVSTVSSFRDNKEKQMFQLIIIYDFILSLKRMKFLEVSKESTGFHLSENHVSSKKARKFKILSFIETSL